MKRIVRYKIIPLLCLVLFSMVINGQEINVQLSGHIFDLDSVSPISGHLVEVEIEYSGIVEFFTVISDESGFYHIDSIFIAGPGSITASTFDCFGQPQVHQDYITPINNMFVFDFYLCTDTTTGCTAQFGYEILPGTYYDVMFFDLSVGNHQFWQWDFGDSTISNELNPVHHFVNPGFYNVCLTISDNSGNCEDTFCEDIFVENGPMDCENWFSYSTNDNLTFDFNGFSIPVAQEYFWDFGDGTTAYGPIFSHTYSNAINDFVPVTLTTIHYNPSFGDSCLATTTQLIFVGNTVPCNADFIFGQDPLNFLTYHFTDNSSGSISGYFWDFGDGAYSEQQNPVHLFPGPGIYPVCLTIISDSLGVFCSDLFCQDINIEYELTTYFEIYLDTLSGPINQYQFYDLSVGEPGFWQWDFGDGNISSDQNPVHQYENSGQYEICLDVSRDFTNGSLYSDSYCMTIETPNYFDLGGQVFIDDIPMNNFNGDTTVIDTGMALLYRKYNDFIVAMDTNYFYQYGYYWFTGVREGEYLVKIHLTENSENYMTVVPAYHQNNLFWTEAQGISLMANNFEAAVNLPPLQPIGQGPGSISGSIVINGSKLIGDIGLSGMLIILFNENMAPVAFRMTNDLGQFNFDNLPIGDYSLYAESTGLFTNLTEVNLDDSNTSFTDVVIELYPQAVSVNEQKNTNFELGYFYPNPVVGNLHLNLNSNEKIEIKATIYEITGRKIMEYDIHLNLGAKIWEVNTSEFPEGMYIVTFVPNGSKIPQIRKFVK